MSAPQKARAGNIHSSAYSVWSGVCYTPSASWNSGGYKENPIEKPSNWAKGSQDDGSEHGKVTPEAPFRGLRMGRNPTLRARSPTIP
ncbi:hypothetical protein M404DRAFT_998793, partial [Pisolithus tinctorius Marx 270]